MQVAELHRRGFTTLLGGAAMWPLATRAQQPAMPVVGFLGSTSSDLYASRVRAFHHGLRETGYIEGRNVAIEYRWAEGQNDRMPALAADLVRRHVAVIAVGGIPGTLAAKTATATIPIVFQSGIDPVRVGLVASLNRPGGNLTGVSNLSVEVGPKRLELLHELVPTAKVVAVLVNPNNPVVAETITKELQLAAGILGLQLLIQHAGTSDFDAAFAALLQRRAGALVIGNDGLFNTHIKQLAELTARYKVPTVFLSREFAAAGGLMSYGGDSASAFRQVGVYTGRILKGEKPADLPVQQSTKVELIINLKTAKALGLDVPATLLARADEVIE